MKILLIFLGLLAASAAVVRVFGSALTPRILLPVFGVAALACLLVPLGLRNRRRIKDVFKDAAELLGLEYQGDFNIAGTFQGYETTVSKFSEKGRFGFRVTIDTRDRSLGFASFGFRVYPERDYVPGIFRRVDALNVNDPEFDGRVRIEGRPEEAMAFLGESVRDTIEGTIELDQNLWVEGGRVTLEDESPVISPEELAHRVKKALRVVKMLEKSSTQIVESLARNALKDRIHGVRSQNLELLKEHFPGHPVTRRVMRKGLEDLHAEVRLRAAEALGEEGFDTLKNLVLMARRAEEFAAYPLTPEDLPERVAVRALDIMTRTFEPARLLPLVRREARGRDGPLRAAALRALGTLGDATSEEDALKALRSQSKEVVLAAVEALGAIGTAAAVAPLRAVVEGRTLDFTMKGGVYTAISRIKERLSGAGEGQVTLAAEKGSEGRVSLAREKEGGRLALKGHRESAGETAPNEDDRARESGAAAGEKEELQ